MKILLDINVPDPRCCLRLWETPPVTAAPLQVGSSNDGGADGPVAHLVLSRGRWRRAARGVLRASLYFLASTPAMDCWEKRKKRGFLFLTGDEIPYATLSKHIVETVIGDRLDDDLTVEEVVAELQKTYVPFFVIPTQDAAATASGDVPDLLGDHVLCMDSPICLPCHRGGSSRERVAPDFDAPGRTFHDADMPEDRIKVRHAGLEASQRGNHLNAYIVLDLGFGDSGRGS